ncbi:DUF6777 domain-containing protein [Streptomyces sp. NPDC006879]|uniref:DUF6777 domain-containing protein n=1 Tax=Streptomyces sp. NPDC006879 TaxID=3364767 RepID=UPI00369C5418
MAVVLALVLSRTSGDGGGSSNQAAGEIFLEPVSATGPDPYTSSSANDAAVQEQQPSASGSSPPPAQPTGNQTTRSVSGATAGVYGGSMNVAACDVEKQIRALLAEPSKNRAFASVLGIQPAGVQSYLRSLTPLLLSLDTRVTNHGYQDGKATTYQAVLQAGTAVLVDDRGVPRVRCACGNPLGQPVAVQGTPKPAGTAWPGYRPTQTVVIAPAPQPVTDFVIYDRQDGQWVSRESGDHDGHMDRVVPEPKRHEQPEPGLTSMTPSQPTGTTSASQSPSRSDSDTTSPPPTSRSESAPPSESSSAPTTQSASPPSSGSAPVSSQAADASSSAASSQGQPATASVPVSAQSAPPSG